MSLRTGRRKTWSHTVRTRHGYRIRFPRTKRGYRVRRHGRRRR